MKAIGYVRVSTQEQTHGFGLDVQEQAIRKWASEQRARLVSIERDEAVSGSNGLEDRPGLAGALIRLEAGDAEALVVYRLDRLARDLVLQETTIRRLEQRGRRVVSVTEPNVDGGDPTRVLVRQVLGALAQYERAVIRARMMAGVAAKRAAGGYVGGQPPYGWAAQDGELAPVDSEQAAIRRMGDLRSEGHSFGAIAAALNAEGIASKRGRRWAKWTVREVLRRSG